MFSPFPVWKEAPFIRLLVPFILAIPVQWYFDLKVGVGCIGTIISFFLLLLFSASGTVRRFKNYWTTGVLVNCLVFFSGLVLVYFKNTANHPDSIIKIYKKDLLIVAKLEEPLCEKPRSHKAVASVDAVKSPNSTSAPKGNIIIYFEKENFNKKIDYGSRVVFSKNLQAIKSSSNPGSFDYRRYCQFQGIHYQVYLKAGDYVVLPPKQNVFKNFLFTIRKGVVNIMREYIPGKKESGLAEALLIGYKDDLDKNLVESYSNTGVVHIIAISGLHVGLIYGMLVLILSPLSKRKNLRWLKLLLVISGLWIFSLLAGGTPSVLRSTVMFTFIIAGQSFSRSVSIFNSLAASGFLLLCYNPFWLWDVGFQLSYAAVLSILIFMKPVYNLWFINNKILDAIWKLNAVTLSAQILTVPICLFYFHQFPNLFLIVNLVAVPLSSLILIGELVLCLASLVTPAAIKIGSILHWLIWLMNTFIERLGRLPFAVFENIELSVIQLILLYLLIISLSIGINKRKKFAMATALGFVLIIGLVRCTSKFRINFQRKLIVYNIPNQQAIDFIEGRNYFFKGDDAVVADERLHIFHLKPSRILHQVSEQDSLPSLYSNDFYFRFCMKNIIVIEKPYLKNIVTRKIPADILIISKNPEISIADIHSMFNCKKIIFDTTNPAWRVSAWTKECNQLKIPCYSVAGKGAFVMIMN